MRTHSCRTIEMSQQWSGKKKNFCYLEMKHDILGWQSIERRRILWHVSQCLFGEIMLFDLAKGFRSVKALFQERNSLMCRSFLPSSDTVPRKSILLKKEYTVREPKIASHWVRTMCLWQYKPFKNLLQESSQGCPLSTCIIIFPS